MQLGFRFFVRYILGNLFPLSRIISSLFATRETLKLKLLFPPASNLLHACYHDYKIMFLVVTLP